MAHFIQFNVAKVLLACCLFLSIHTNMQSTHASSIPIWEFLTRNEKMSYLYSTFAQLVSVHCKATTATSHVPVNQCKRDLLNYGYEKLQTITDSQLDAFDPYQRGATQLIWSSIMRDHPSSTLVTTRTPLPTPPATSIVIMSHQQPSTTKTKFIDTTTNANQYAKNPMFDSSEQKHQYAMDMDIAYGQPSMAHNPQIDVFDSSAHKTYLTGPSVVRVKPDGSPVEEDQHKAPVKDDDLVESYATVTFSRSDDIKMNSNSNSNNQQKHRKIATINALKQQYLANLARQQQELLPPYILASHRRRRAQPVPSHYGNVRL